MDHMRTFAISQAGLQVERMRVEVAALNLANANTVLKPGQPGYQPLKVSALSQSQQFAAMIDGGLALPEASIVTQGTAPRAVHDPKHPAADAQGMVYYPAVDSAEQMIELMGAVRSYEANIAAINAARSMALKALEIGGGA